MTPTEILALPMAANDAQAATIRDYLCTLLLKVWTEEDKYVPKKPWGFIGWKYPVHEALANAGVIQSDREDGDIYLSWDTKAGDAVIAEAIRGLGEIVKAE